MTSPLVAPPAVSALAGEYATRFPFPHVVLPNFLGAGVAEKLNAEFALVESGPWTHWAHYNENKSGLTERAAFPPLMARVVDELNSDAFVEWLSELTGIPNLLADPTLEGGGMHQCGAGGFLNIHADFTRHHHKTHLRRRVNLIVYLNPDWKPEWGGAIEFWDRRMQQCAVRIPPLANHAVIFNTDEHSFHGFPVPVACPAGVMRRSLALYYYTAEDNRDARVVQRSTNYQARPGDGIKERALIWADNQLLHLYSSVKSRLGLSDAFASRSLAWFDHWRRSQVTRWLEAGAWMLAIALGAAQAWTWRFRPSTMDLVSYLDVGDAYVHGYWKEAINGYWNPLYSWVLGVVMAVVRPSATLEYPTAKLVDFLIYLLCLWSFAWLLTNLRRVYRNATAAQPDEVPAIPDWAWIVGGYTLFIWSSSRWITLSSSTPDMAGTALLYSASALLLRFEQHARRADYLLLGAILALAYFSRTPMFVIAIAVLTMLALHAVTIRDRRGVLAAAVVFLVLTLPFAVAISRLLGHVTIGDNGVLNHAWLANPGSYIIPNRHWQGGPPGYGAPLHPSRVLWTWPPVYEFGRPIRETFPPWTDPSYWYEGLTYHVDSAAEWRTAKDNALFYGGMFGGWLLAGYLAVLLVAGDLRATASAVARYMRYLAPAVLGLVIYGLANDLLLQDQPTPQPPSRYVAVYVVLLVLFLAASIRFRPVARRSLARGALALALGAMSVGAVAALASQQRAGLGKAAAEPEPWRLAEDLRHEGVAPTMRVAIIGSPSLHDLWARLARVRIMAEVPNEASFWAQPASAQQDILRVLASAGVSAVVVPHVPPTALERGWHVTKFGYGVYWPDGDARRVAAPTRPAGATGG